MKEGVSLEREEMIRPLWLGSDLTDFSTTKDGVLSFLNTRCIITRSTSSIMHLFGYKLMIGQVI